MDFWLFSGMYIVPYSHAQVIWEGFQVVGVGKEEEKGKKGKKKGRKGIKQIKRNRWGEKKMKKWEVFQDEWWEAFQDQWNNIHP